MGPWVWGEAGLAILLVGAGGVTWWLARGCIVTITGAAGAVIGGVVSLGLLAVMLDYETALRISVVLTIASTAWLLGFAIAGRIRGQRALRAERAAECLRFPVEEIPDLATDARWDTVGAERSSLG